MFASSSTFRQRVNVSNGYLSLSLISSTALLFFLGVLASCCCPNTPMCVSTFPLLLVCRNTSSVLALAGHCGGFCMTSCHLFPLACLTLTAPLPPPTEVVVLLRRVAGPLITALSLISAASVMQFFVPGWHCWSKCCHPFLSVSIRSFK